MAATLFAESLFRVFGIIFSVLVCGTHNNISILVFSLAECSRLKGKLFYILHFVCHKRWRMTAHYLFSFLLLSSTSVFQSSAAQGRRITFRISASPDHCASL